MHDQPECLDRAGLFEQLDELLLEHVHGDVVHEHVGSFVGVRSGRPIDSTAVQHFEVGVSLAVEIESSNTQVVVWKGALLLRWLVGGILVGVGVSLGTAQHGPGV